MGDTFDKVAPRAPRIIPAATWNGLLEAGRDYQRRKAPGGGAAAANSPLNPAVRVLVRNDTGGALAAGAVLALGTPVIDAVDYPRDCAMSPLFPGTAAAAATDAFAVTIDPLEEDEVGRAVLMGVVSCDVVVNDNAHVYAEPAAAVTATLSSASSGPARILWREAGSSGTKKALVAIVPAAPAPAAEDSPFKAPVRCRATGNVNVANPGTSTFDGVTAASGDRVLLPAQTSADENGVYLFNGSASAMTRTDDADTAAKLLGATVYVSEGTVWKDTFFTCTTDAPITIGVTSTTWAQTPSASTTVAGYVNTAAQSFLGTKTFAGATSANPGRVIVEPDATNGIVTAKGTGTTTGQAQMSASGATGGFAASGIGTGSDTTAASVAASSVAGTVSCEFVDAGVGTYGIALEGGSGYTQMTWLHPNAGLFGAAYVGFLYGAVFTGGPTAPYWDWGATNNEYFKTKHFLATTDVLSPEASAGTSGGFGVYDGAGAVTMGLSTSVTVTIPGPGTAVLTFKNGILTSVV